MMNQKWLEVIQSCPESMDHSNWLQLLSDAMREIQTEQIRRDVDLIRHQAASYESAANNAPTVDLKSLNRLIAGFFRDAALLLETGETRGL